MAKTVEDYIEERLFDNAKVADDLPVVDALIRFNRFLHRAENKIAHFVMENYFDEWLNIDLVAGQNEYDLPLWDSEDPAVPTIAEFKKLLECSIKYGTDSWGGFGVKATELPAWSLPRPLWRYTENQPQTLPYFRFDNKKLRIYPTPTEDVTWWLILRYARSNVDVELTTLESELSIPRDYIWVILEGMTYQLVKTNKHTAVIWFHKDEREEALKTMLTDIGDRYLQPWIYKNPNLTNLMRN